MTATMTKPQKTAEFLSQISEAESYEILDNIAANYGIERAQALSEVLDDDAESLLDYVTGDLRAVVHVKMITRGFTL